MNKRIRSIVLAVFLAAVCLFSSTFGMLATATEGLAITASAATQVKITTQPKSVTVAKGKTAAVKVVASGEGLTYKWYYKDKGASKYTLTKSFTGNTYSVKMNADRDGRRLFCRVTDKNGNMVQTKTVTINMKAGKVEITTQPKSVTVANGKTATVKVAATGTGLTYKWYYKDAGASKYTLTKSFTGNTYSVKMNKDRDGRRLFCRIYDKSGNMVQTKTVTINMKAGKVEITTQPKSVTVANGKTATVKVAATGTGLTYKWYYKNAGSSKFTLSTTVKTATYSVEMNKSRSGRQIYCVVTDKAGNKVKSNTVTLSMTGGVKITTQPKSVTVANGKTATVKVAATGTGLTYKWYYKNAGSSKFTLSTTVKTATYSVEMNKSRSGRQIYCVVTDKAGNSVKSNTVTLSLLDGVKITTQPKDVAVLSGKTATVKVVASGEGLTYKWYYKNAGASKFSVTKSFVGNTYTTEMNSARSGRQIYCVITDKNGNSVKSNVVTLTMATKLEITRQPENVVAPKGSEIKFTLEAKGDELTYKWYYKNAGDTKFTRTSTFTSTYYTAEMSSARSGRQVYCVVSDKYGNSVQSKTVTMYMGTPLAITRQPVPATAAKGGDVAISFTAEGEGLTYKWYYKNAGASKFSVTKTFTSNYYTTEMSADRDGRQVYCVVTDKYGYSVKTDVVTMHLGMPITVTLQPESVTLDAGKSAVFMVGAVGENITYQWYTKAPGAAKFTKADATGANYTVKMTDALDGTEVYCVITDKNGAQAQTDTATLSLSPAYRITVDLGFGEPYIVNVKKDGKYKLSKPTRPGYGFQGWQTAAGTEFASSGTVGKDMTVHAVWKVAGTNTLEELINRANGGASEIVITGNITVNQPIYISYETKIYSNKNCTIKRDPNYAGDIFVVGKDANGVTSLLNHRKAALTLGGGSGTLTIDGNRDNMKVDVVGSLIFAGDSCTVNLYDGVRLRNNNKVGNDRMLTYLESSGESSLTRAGGAAIINNNSVVNMYGGIIENNAVKTEHTVVTDAQGVETKQETAGCGGAIYNNGAFNMYGGTIKNNEALRGGAIYIMKPAALESGTIQGNKSYTYGGAVSTSSSQYANLYVGGDEAGKTMLIKDNFSVSAGGALYSNTTAPIIVLGNATFEGNHSDYSGGAIYTGGSLVVRNTSFRGNSSVYSAGAIFFQNTKDSTWQPREAEITGCVFEENKASLGGAITFSRSNKDDPKATGVVARVTDCRFYKNEAVKNDANPGNGGAIYVTQLADATITGCEFTENIAASSGGGVSVNGQANAKLSNNTFTGNTAVTGGGMYLSVDTTSSLKNLTFTGNKAVFSETGTGGNGGAIYAYSAKVAVENLDIRNNTAAQHAGAMYLGAITLTLGADTKIEGNSAGDHGGAFYLTYKTNEDNTKTGAKLILNNTELKNNTAKTGGVISIRTDCEATLNGAKLLNNSATAPVDEVMGGGAVYVGFGKLTLTDVTMDGNTSAYYGGAIFARKSEVSITGGSVTGSAGATGAALYFREGSTVTLKDLSVTGNTASSNGVIYANAGTLDMVKVTASGNKASSGGVLYTSGASTVVTLKDSTWSGNTASNGGALFMSDATVTLNNCDINENTARLGGAIYNKLGKLTTENVTFFKNAATKTSSGSAGNGGAVNLVGGTYNVSEKDAFLENTAENHAGAIYVSYFENETDKSRTGGVLTATGGTFTGNTAMGGGAVSIRTDGEASFDGTTFTGNKVTGNDGKADGYGEGGGAVYVGYGKLTLKDVTATDNTAETTGGAVHVLDSEATVTGSTFAENEAKTGGAIYVMSTSVVSITDSAFTGNSAAGNGGALYLSAEAEVTTDNLDMQNNSAGGNGGAIYLQGMEMTLDSGDVFKNNTAGGHGGAIYLVYVTNKDNSRTGAVLNATDTIFEGNTAMAGGAISARSSCVVNLNGTTLKNNAVTGFQDDGDETTTNDNNGDGEGGGAIYVGYGELTMENVTATGNTASDFGGVVDAVASPVTITGGTYSDNATNNGGVLHAMSGCEITVSGAEFKNNKSLAENTEYNSSIGGGVFHTEGGKLHITGSTFTENTSANYGGVLHTNKTAVTIDGETAFTGNSGATGAVMHMRSAKVTLESITLENNTSNMNGVIYYAGSDLTLDKVTATGNKANQGGILFVNAAGVTVKNSTFSGNSASNGGVLYSKGGSTVGIENCQLTENTATYGGAVYLIENSKLNLTGTTFLKNSATKDGGAIYNKASTVTATDTETAKNTFTENTAANHGGAIYVVYTTNETDNTKIPGVLNVTGGSFTGNTAMGGGAVSARTDCEASFDGTTFTENKVTGNDGTADGYGEGGGAVYVGYGKLTLTDITATGNTSENYGGAVHLLDSDATVTGSSFAENAAADGGAVYAKVGGNVVITDSTFTGNTASASAGAVYVAAPVTGELKNLVFQGNHADDHGGALYIGKAAVATENLDMQNNTAGGNGGAVYLNAVEMTLTANDVFKGNSAGGHGGAFYLTYSGEQGASLIGTDVVFENNTAKAGGAISSRSYCNVELTGATLKGNKSTAPQSDTDRLGGGAIYTNTNTLTLHGVTLEGNTAAYYGGAIYATQANVTIDEKSVIKGNGAVTGVAMYFYTSGSATLNDVTVTENVYTTGNSNGVIYLTGSVALDVEKLTATNNKSVNGGVFYVSGSVSGTIKDSVFTGNTATANGGVIDFRSSGTLDVTGCTITENTAKNGGAIYCEKGVVNVSSQLSNNTATASGGAISVAGKGVVNVLEEASLTENSAPIGGAVYLDLGGTANITGATLENNKAEKGSGGAIAATDKSEETPAPATLTITNATLKNNTAKYGGAVHMDKGCNATVTGGTMTGNTAELGGAVFGNLSSLTLADAVFTENSATSNGGAIYNNGGNVTGTATFDKNSAAGHAGALYLTYVKGTDGAANIPGTATLTGGAFTNNTAKGGGAVSIRTGCSGTFENVTFTGNSVSGFQDDGNAETENDNDGDGEGGGAFYVGYGSVTLNNVTATGNVSTDSFGGFLDSVQGEVTINGGTYTGNTAPAGGAIYSLYNSQITITDAEISENESTFVNPYKVDNTDTYDSLKGGGAIAMNKGTLTVSNTTLDGNKSIYYGGTILAAGATVTLNENTVVSGSTGKTGAAIYLRDSGKTRIENSSILNNKDAGSGVIYISWGTLDLVNVTASGNTANTGGVLNASGSGATVNVTGGTYSGNSATYGGAIYISKEAKVNLSGATFTENTSHLGGAIYSTGSTLTAENSTFTKNSVTKDSNGGNGNGGAITVVGGTLTGSGNNVFTENTAENHAGAIYVSYTNNSDGTKTGGVMNFTDGLFEGNSALAGGALSARTDCVINLTGTKLTENNSSSDQNNAGGGAIYVGWGSITMDGVTLDGNSSAYYGGAVEVQGSPAVIKNTVIKNNTGITGSAIYFRDGETATLTDVTITGNTGTAGNGTVYITGAGTLNMTDVDMSDNSNANGGILYASGSAKVYITGGEYKNNTSTGTGNADFRTSGEVVISGATFTGNTGVKGGALYAYGGNVNVTVKDDTLFKENTAKNGGAIYIDQGAKVTLSGNALDGNSSTADGGAIYVADTTKDADVATTLVMNGTTLQNNTSGARGGALATDTGSPKLVITATNCTFQKNTSTTSGGAVCVQNSNCNSETDPTAVPIVFTNCTFRENSSKTDGGAIDVRTNSCIKIDGITAEDNTAASNGGAVYVTSERSRLYLTGTVTQSGNTHGSASTRYGPFIGLYNNNYTNPPKIYTTHSSTAEWYADVGGNRTSIVFDLTTLP